MMRRMSWGKGNSMRELWPCQLGCDWGGNNDVTTLIQELLHLPVLEVWVFVQFTSFLRVLSEWCKSNITFYYCKTSICQNQRRMCPDT